LVGGQRFHLLVFDFRQGAALRRIAGYQLLLHGEIVRRANHLMDVPHRFGSQTFRFLFRFNAVYPATIQQMLIEPLQVQRCQVCQRNAADLRLDVVFQKALRGFEGRWAQLDFCVVLHPDLQPCSYGVGFGPPIVDAHIFLDGFLQLFLNLRLRLAEDIFDDGLASFEIVTNCVPAFPSSILAFSDIAFAVCSSFWHKISLLCNGKGYRNQGSKATRKSNCYQKVIICPSEPRRLIFAYGGAISALPGAFSLVTAVQFSNG